MSETCPFCKKLGMICIQVDCRKDNSPYLIRYRCKKCGYRLQKKCNINGAFEGYQIELIAGD